MDSERKRVEKKEIPKVLPRVRTEVELPVEKPKTKSNYSNKFIRIAQDSSREEFRVISDRVAKKEISLAYYAIDNDKGYHYYLIN